MQEVKFLHNSLAGASAGAVKVILIYPNYILRSHMSTRIKLFYKIFNPLLLYRGSLPYAINNISRIAIMAGLTGHYQSYIPINSAAFIGGMSAAAIIQTPIDNIIINHNRFKLNGSPNYLSSIGNLYGLYGFKGFYTGLAPCMLREGLMSWAIFAGKDRLQIELNCNNLLASIITSTLCLIPLHWSNQLVLTMLSNTNSKSIPNRFMYRPNVYFMFRYWYYICFNIYIMDYIYKKSINIITK